jgi:hypothetical protein
MLGATQEGIAAGQGIDPTPRQDPAWLQIPLADRVVGLAHAGAHGVLNVFCVQVPALVHVPSVQPLGPALRQT